MQEDMRLCLMDDISYGKTCIMGKHVLLDHNSMGVHVLQENMFYRTCIIGVICPLWEDMSYESTCPMLQLALWEHISYKRLCLTG